MSPASLQRTLSWTATLCLAPALVGLSQAAASVSPESNQPAPLSELDRDPEGIPQIHLDRLDFPDVPGASTYKKALERFLRKEARRHNWGAGRQSRIEYRFEVTELSIWVEGDVLRVRCSARGRLPKSRTALSRLTFGGDPARQTQVVQQVLEIVGRGVLTRLAQLERQRRGLE